MAIDKLSLECTHISSSNASQRSILGSFIAMFANFQHILHLTIFPTSFYRPFDTRFPLPSTDQIITLLLLLICTFVSLCVPLPSFNFLFRISPCRYRCQLIILSVLLSFSRTPTSSSAPIFIILGSIFLHRYSTSSFLIHSPHQALSETAHNSLPS